MSKKNLYELMRIVNNPHRPKNLDEIQSDINHWIKQAKKPDYPSDRKPKIIELVCSFAEKYIVFDMPQKAVNCMDSLEDSFIGYAKYHFTYACALCKLYNKDSNLEHLKKAASHLEDAVKYNSDYIAAYRLLMRTYLRLEEFDKGNLAKAAKIVDKCRSDDKSLCVNFMTYLAESGRIDAALARFAIFVQIYPDYDHGFAELAKILNGLGKHGDAKKVSAHIKGETSSRAISLLIGRDEADQGHQERLHEHRHGRMGRAGGGAEQDGISLGAVDRVAARATKTPTVGRK